MIAMKLLPKKKQSKKKIKKQNKNIG